jgi:PmbA protein
MRSSEESLRILERALGVASKGVDDAEVSLGGGVLGHTHFADSRPQHSSFVDREVLSIRVSVGGRIGRSETSDHTSSGIQNAARQAKMLAELLPRAEGVAGFPDAQRYATVDAYDPETERATALDRMALVGRAIMHGHRRALRASGRVMTGYGAHEASGRGCYAIANSRGLAAFHAATRASLELRFTDERDRSGWAGAESFALSDLDLDSVLSVADAKATVPGTPTALEPGPRTAVLEPAALAALLRFVAESCGAREMHAGASFLSERLDTAIAASSVTIRDDFAHELHRGTPFDVEGVARRRVVLVDKGVARGPVYGHASAVQDGLEPTGHSYLAPGFGLAEGASHLVMEGGEETLAQLVARVDDGVLVSRLGSVRLVDRRNLVVTGVSRDGALRIRGGEIAGPVEDFRFQLSLLDLLQRVDGLGPVSATGGMVVPPALVRELPILA